MNIKYILSLSIITLAVSLHFAPSAYAADECSAASFKVSSSLTLELPPSDLAVADFNGDGHLDLVATDQYSNEVVVLFSRGGAESFGPPVGVPVGAGLGRVAVGDFNGDGKPDLITNNNPSGSNSGNLSVLLNDGSGKFGAPIVTNVVGSPYWPVIADLNNDGELDLVVGIYTGGFGGKVAVLLGTGTGSFSQAANSPFDTSSVNAAEVTLGDFNEDGKIDLALPGGTSGADIFLGDGAGGFSAAIHSPATSGYMYQLSAADFNGDGHIDLVGGGGGNTGISSSSLFVMLGNGNGSFNNPVTMDVPLYISEMVARDVNKDGKLDLTLSGFAGVKILLGDGAGGFTFAQTYSVGPQPTEPVFGDFNEDGNVDIAIGQGLTGTSYSIEVLYGNGAGAFIAPLSFATSVSHPHELIAADFNKDGKQDFATISRDYVGGTAGASSIEVALGNGDGSFIKKPLIRFPGGTLLSSIVAADFNKDGSPDLAVTLPLQGKVSILLNDGTGGFATDGFSAPSFATYPYGYQPSKIKAGDFNNDGNPDLVALTPNSNNFVVMLGNGAGSFTMMGGEAAGPYDLAVADFDGDGKLDLINGGAAGSDTRVSLYQGLGDGRFKNINQYEMQQDYIVSIVASDFNNDGRPDMAVTSSNLQNKYVTVFLNNGAGAFTSRTTYTVEGAGVVTAGDFNSDGKTDLAIASGVYTVGGYFSGISILTNIGAGVFATPVTFSAGPASDYLVVSDFNNDGKDDALFTQQSSHSLALLLNNFNGTVQQCLSVNDVTVTEGDTGTTDAVFTVTLSGASAQTVRVNYFFEAPYQYDGLPLKKGVDFENVPGTLTFAPGVTTQTVRVPVKGDTIDEFDEFFNLRLSTPINALISDAKGVATIIDNDQSPAFSVNDVSIAEGNPFNATAANFTISLSAASEKPISVQYSLAPGTATSNTDYSSVSATLDFPAGTTSKTISVPITPDNVFEPDETFFVNLSNATNASVADGQGQGTILNDDAQPSIRIASSVNLNEGAAGTNNNAVFSVSLSNPSYQAITVNYATADGTATAGSDYAAAAGTLTFNPGETAKSLTVQSIGDNTDEIDETFFVNLSNQTNSTIASGQGLGTIFDDDGPTISINDITVTEGNTGTVNANFTVTLSASSVQDVYFNYATTAGSASSNIDFQRVFSTPFVIPAGATSGTLTVKIIGDYQIEPDETFTVILSAADNGTIVDSLGVCTIANDDAPGTLQFSAPSYSVNEGGIATVSVTRTDGGTGTVTVDYSTSNGTASAGIDYFAASGTLTFNQGETSKTFSISTVNDGIHEGDETVNLTLSNQTGGAVLGSRSTAQLTVVNDDSRPPQVQFSQTSYAVGEAGGSAHIVVTRTDATAAASVDFATSDGSGLNPCSLVTSLASSRCDYATTIGTLRFAVGENSKTIFIPIVDDNIGDGDETFTLTLSNPTGASLGAISIATITITDNVNGVGNPIDEASFFIRQHYIDFLGREPEPAGLAGWLNVYNNCGTTIAQPCDRIEISSAFFRSEEFQTRAYFIYRLYSAVGRIPLYEGFMPDLAKVSGFLSAQELEANKVAFVNEFMTRPDYQNKYGALTDPTSYVDALLQTVGLPDHPGRAGWIAGLTNNSLSRAQVLRSLVESGEVYQKYYTEAFVIMQYFGYLRRSADISYLNWIQTMNSNGGDYRTMINGFLNSAEYRNRFAN